MYEDKAFTLPTTAYSDISCNLVTSDHILCNYYLVDDDVGVFSLFSGIANLVFPNKTEESEGNEGSPVGAGRFVWQGGSDLHAGILGRVTTIYEKDIIKHDFCVQGSTYDHLVPPLSEPGTASPLNWDTGTDSGSESSGSANSGSNADGSYSNNAFVHRLSSATTVGMLLVGIIVV